MANTLTPTLPSIIKPIRKEKEYAAALAAVEKFFDKENAGKKLTKAEVDLMELLCILIEKYEDDHYAIPYPDPIAAIRFRMEQQGLRNADLATYMGSASRVSEVLSGKRKLTLDMVVNLHKGLAIPLESLLGVG